MLVAVLVAAMFIMIAYSSVDNNSYITNSNDIKSNNSYVKIGNITFMNNFIDSNNGTIIPGKIFDCVY